MNLFGDENPFRCNSHSDTLADVIAHPLVTFRTLLPIFRCRGIMTSKVFYSNLVKGRPTMALHPKYFLVERDGPVIIWKYNNPPKNLWSAEVVAEYNQLVEEMNGDAALRVGIFTSALPNVFIQHYDVSLLVTLGERLKANPNALPPSPPRPAYRPGSKVIIAAINARLAGGGLEFAQACDFRFMSRTAWAAQLEVVLGILAGGGGTQRMPRLIGIDKALEIQLTGRAIYADEAERIGLITRACDPHKLMEEAIAFAKRIAAQPPLAVAHIRKAIYEGMNMPLVDGLALESKLFMELVKSDDALRLMKEYVAGGQDAEKLLTEIESAK
jgi:enoyl-CoA hydratase